ncbi:MAG: VOC family protein [Actinomycetota bacterium]|nr:VOC family protein [Actinomycetota bacterium]
MVSSIQPIIVTRDLDRLLVFYQSLFSATETLRQPPDGPIFYLGLRIGESELGLVADSGVDVDAAQRILLSIGVDNVDGMLELVEPAGGQLLGPPNDMPWGQRVAHIKDPDGNAVNLTQTIQLTQAR